MKYSVLTFIFALCIFISSCDKDENSNLVGDYYDPVEYDIEGIELRRVSEVSIHGDIPPEGARFVITGKGRNVDLAFICYLKVNGERQSGDAPMDLRVPWYEVSGEWGKVTYLTQEPPYIMEFVISPNDTGNVRKIEMELGHSYWFSHIILTQLPKQ